MSIDDPGKQSVEKKTIKGSLLKGFSPLLKKRAEDHNELLRRLREAWYTWTPSKKRRTKKPILRGATKRKKNKAVREARKHNRPARKNRKHKRNP